MILPTKFLVFFYLKKSAAGKMPTADARKMCANRIHMLITPCNYYIIFYIVIRILCNIVTIFSVLSIKMPLKCY